VGTSIKAISYYLPEKVLGNEELSKVFPEYSADEVYRRSGVIERHISAENELPSDMAVKAAEKLFTEQDIDKKNIDFLIFCSMLLDRQAPTTACLLQERLGLSKNIGAIDMPMGCSGYIYGLCIAKSLIHSGVAKNVLILAGDCTTKTIQPDDHALRFLFGDGMTASLISHSNEENIGSFVLGSDGSGESSLVIQGANARENSNPEWLKQNPDAAGMPYGKLFMHGLDVLSFTLKTVPTMINDLLVKERLAMEDIDMFVFHQPGGFVLEKLKRKMNIPDEKFFVNIQNRGNTVSATIPIAVCDALNEKRIKKGSRILLAGFGIGLSWGCTIVTL
jgi:3-oxoacyl-[acyl-carrier-protein] synthase-3